MYVLQSFCIRFLSVDMSLLLVHYIVHSTHSCPHTHVCSILFFCQHIVLFLYFFFFSSRRRHTRFDCDWSSDVCSSDLISCRMATRMSCTYPPPRRERGRFDSWRNDAAFSVSSAICRASASDAPSRDRKSVV